MHKSNGGIEFWEKEKNNVIDMYVNKKMRTGEIAKKYGCWTSTVSNHLKDWGFNLKRERHNATYTLDTHFFDSIDTEEKAYFVGLLLSDGHISKRNVIMLTMKDLDIIQKYKDAIKTNKDIRKDRYGNYYLNITSKSMCMRLREMGFHNRKSYEFDINKILQFIPNNLIHHFVRGMFDGDGSIRIYKYEYVKNPQYHLGYTGLYNVVSFVKKYLGLHTKTVKESDLTYTCVTACKEDILRIFELLYKDATVYIDRKYEIFNKIA